MKANKKQYFKMWTLYKKGKITESEWRNFCSKCLENLMIENKKTLENLK
jgi:hypothetical protein